MAQKIIARNFTNKLKKQEMDDVFVEFYRLDEILENKDQHIQNYIVIRLVTVIEQFFRKIVEEQIKSGNIHNIPSQITLNTSDFMHVPQIYKERLISSSYSFQSIDAISDAMKHYNVKNPFLDEQISKLFKALFALRHDTVHTVMPLKEDVGKYHRFIENMIMRVLENIYGGNR